MTRLIDMTIRARDVQEGDYLRGLRVTKVKRTPLATVITTEGDRLNSAPRPNTFVKVLRRNDA